MSGAQRAPVNAATMVAAAVASPDPALAAAFAACGFGDVQRFIAILNHCSQSTLQSWTQVPPTISLAGRTSSQNCNSAVSPARPLQRGWAPSACRPFSLACFGAVTGLKLSSPDISKCSDSVCNACLADKAHRAHFVGPVSRPNVCPDRVLSDLPTLSLLSLVGCRYASVFVNSTYAYAVDRLAPSPMRCR